MANQQGWNQQTPAVQALLRGAVGAVRRSTGSKKRGKRRAATAKRRATSGSGSGKRTRKRKSSKASRLVKGSAAAKRYMAKLRKMRK